MKEWWWKPRSQDPWDGELSKLCISTQNFDKQNTELILWPSPTSWTSQVVLVVKNPPANAGDVGSIPWSGRCPGGGHGNPLLYSCLENPMNRGAWWAIVHWVKKSQTQLKWLSTHVPYFLCRQKINLDHFDLFPPSPSFMPTSLWLHLAVRLFQALLASTYHMTGSSL